MDSRVVAQINASWAVRPYRDELFMLEVDGTSGSAVAGLWHFVYSRRPLHHVSFGTRMLRLKPIRGVAG
jgi:hypothetical protein